MKRQLPNIAFLVCLILAFFVYIPGTSGYFLFDDIHNIVENTHIRIQSLDLLTLKRAALSGYAGMLGRPISVLSFAFNHYFNGLSPFHFKLTNIVIHLLNGICVFILTRILLDSHRQRDPAILKQETVSWISLAVASAWLLHPLNLTGVLYVVQRMTSLAALFTLLGMISYTTGRRRILNNRDRSGWTWIAASVVLLMPLAAFSKENGALLPVFLLLIEIFFFRFQAGTTFSKRLLIALFGLIVLLPAIATLIYSIYNPAWLLGGYASRDFTLSERLMTEARVVWFYIRLIFAPDLAQLGLYHDDMTLSKGMLKPASTLFASAGLLLLGVVTLLFARRQPVAAFGILFFLVGHSLESSVIPLELIHEHRNYLPTYGMLLVMFYYLLLPLHNERSLNIRRGIALLFVVTFAGTTFVRASQWGDSVVMKEREVAHHPNSIRANIAIASFFANMPANSQLEAEDFYQRAYGYFVKAAELSPADTLGLFGLIGMSLNRGMAIEDTWVSALAGRMERYPLTASTGNALASLENCVASGKCKQPPEMMETLIQSALRNPTLQGKAKAQILFAWSDYLFTVKNQRDAAVAASYKAIEACPSELEFQMIHIKMLIKMGKPAEAQTRIVQAREFDKMRSLTASFDELEALVSTHREAQR